MIQEIHFENSDLTGEISLTLKEGQTLNELFSHYIFDFNPDRLEPLAFRVLLGKENVLTLFALDSFMLENSDEKDTNKVPVKKYKIPGVSLSELLHFFGELNFTVSTNNFPIESLKVINK